MASCPCAAPHRGLADSVESSHTAALVPRALAWVEAALDRARWSAGRPRSMRWPRHIWCRP
eukprot:6404368-Pyramimonas_sp.AAC.1